jgi:hypothetical protein
MASVNDNDRKVIKLNSRRSITEDDIYQSIAASAGFVIFTVNLDGYVSAFTSLVRECDIEKVIDAGELILRDLADE